MKRIPIFAGLALAGVLVTVTILIRPTYAINDPCYDDCVNAQDRIGAIQYECYTRAWAESPTTPDVTFNSGCTDASENPGGYSYSCSWHWFRSPPPGCDAFCSCFGDERGCAGGGGFGGGNKIDPTDAACLP